MLYFSICIFVCFVIYCICKPSIIIKHYYYNFNEVDKARLDYEKEQTAKRESLIEKQAAEEMKRLEEEESKNRSISSMINNLNEFMKGE